MFFFFTEVAFIYLTCHQIRVQAPAQICCFHADQLDGSDPGSGLVGFLFMFQFSGTLCSVAQTLQPKGPGAGAWWAGRRLIVFLRLVFIDGCSSRSELLGLSGKVPEARRLLVWLMVCFGVDVFSQPSVSCWDKRCVHVCLVNINVLSCENKGWHLLKSFVVCEADQSRMMKNIWVVFRFYFSWWDTTCRFHHWSPSAELRITSWTWSSDKQQQEINTNK